MFKKAFTLVEIIIVVSIVWLLSVLLSKAYITASQLYMYETNHKNIEKDVLFLTQTVQNLADNTQINYWTYSWFDFNFLNARKWIVSWLYLKDDQFSYKIYSHSWAVMLDKTGSGTTTETIRLTNTWANFVHNLTFKIYPYYNPFDDISLAMPDMKTQPYLAIFLDIRTRTYNEKNRINNVKYQLQQWFNFRYYNN